MLLDLPFTRAIVAPGRAESAISPLTLLRFGFNEPEVIASYPTLKPAADHHAYSQPHRIRHQRIQGRGLAQVGLR